MTNFLENTVHRRPNMSQVKTVSKVYADVLKHLPKEFFVNDDYKLTLDNIDNYAIKQKLGRGRYSEVFEAVQLQSQREVVIKVLKPIKKRKIYREIKVLEMLRGGVNIIELLSVIHIANVKMTALIFEKVHNSDFRYIYLTLSAYDTRFYIHELLKALNYCHSKGIMHRDVKPHNIIVDATRRQLKLIDWGLAEFYFPGQAYNVRVASRYFKPPELLVDYVYYSYSLDMWSLGCMFASMIFRKDPFFEGADNADQLVRIVTILGAHDYCLYLKKYNIKGGADLAQLGIGHSRAKWERFINSENEYLVDKHAIDLLDALLVYDHVERITARDALQHAYFARMQQCGADVGKCCTATGSK